MKAKAILKQFADLLNRQPFRPFTLIVADGATITIDAPAHACIDRRGRIITFNAANGARHIIDTLHVTGIVGDADSHDEGKRSASFQQAIRRVNREPDASD